MEFCSFKVESTYSGWSERLSWAGCWSWVRRAGRRGEPHPASSTWAWAQGSPARSREGSRWSPDPQIRHLAPVWKRGELGREHTHRVSIATQQSHSPTPLMTSVCPAVHRFSSNIPNSRNTLSISVAKFLVSANSATRSESKCAWQEHLTATMWQATGRWKELGKEERKG